MSEFKVGDKVVYKNVDNGKSSHDGKIGKITGVYDDGYCDVIFEGGENWHCRFANITKIDNVKVEDEKVDKVKIPKWLAEKIERLRKGTYHNAHHLCKVSGGVGGSDLSDNNLTIIDLARAIEEGYEIEREYLSLEQVMELPIRTKLKHENYDYEYFVFMSTKGEKVIVNNTHTFTCEFRNGMLEPKWYIVEDVE